MYRTASLIVALAAAGTGASAQPLPPLRCEGARPLTYTTLYECTRVLPQALQQREVLIGLDAADIEASQGGQRQLLAFIEAELGRYDEALGVFPMGPSRLDPAEMPTPESHTLAAAAPAITELARERRIVLVNEAHHDAATRQLTLELLPLLRKAGYTHFAAETLDASDTALAARRYPVAATGGYTKEPLYGDIVREAQRLGYVVVPYEDEGKDSTQQAREEAQAANLRTRVFDVMPDARLFVHAGYAHIDKAASARLFNVDTMAMRLRASTGFDPLSVDQTLLRSWGRQRESGTVTTLIDGFAPSGPSVLVAREGGSPWSVAPQWHDVSVLLPRPAYDATRPTWLDLGGQRKLWTIPRELCADTLPCSVEARFQDEPDDAIPADRYAFAEAGTRAALYLRPGRYRVQAFDRDGTPLGRAREIRVR